MKTVLLSLLLLPLPGWADSFIYPPERKPTPQCHASTLAESGGHLVAAWFGGTREGAPDVGIWVSFHDGRNWQEPVRVAMGKDEEGKPVPCWNPVLFQPKQGPLMLFYKIGAEIRSWKSQLITWDGSAFSEPRQLPDGLCGPVKNKPVELADGTILCPTSEEPAPDRWLVHFSRTRDLGATWEKTGPLNGVESFHAIQPTILFHPDGRLQALCRTKEGVIGEIRSDDQGLSWSPMKATPLPNPNSGIDGVTLADGRQLLVYNPVRKGRSPLVVAVSRDGEKWQDVTLLEHEEGEYSYPAVIQAADGTIHITYTWKRQLIRHVTLDPAKLGRES